jgi:hypothetical protein
MTRKILLCNLIRGWFTGSLTKPRKGKRDSAQQLKLLELESRVVPASAVFANNTLTINLTAGDYFDYFNEYRDSANGNAVTDTAGYFKLSKYSSNTGFSPLKWSGLTDSTGTWKITQVGDGTTGDSLQLAPNKSIDGINIVVKGSSSTTEGCYFRANPDKKDGLFTGFVETDSLVDDTVVQDYPFISQNDIRFLGTTVSAYSDITSTKNITWKAPETSKPAVRVSTLPSIPPSRVPPRGEREIRPTEPSSPTREGRYSWEAVAAPM